MREPVGVVGAITPWNYPLHQVVAKVAAALAAGCTVVLKPSELTPLVAYLLFDAADEAGLPPGVLNLVTGHRPGGRRGASPGTRTWTWCRSPARPRPARAIAHAAADRIAKVALELGGKSANVILDDADLAKAVKVGVGNAFLNSGQTCTAWTRMLVHRQPLRRGGRRWPPDRGRATASATRSTRRPGSARWSRPRQRDRVRGYIERLAGRPRWWPAASDAPVPDRGYFVAPTVFADVRPGQRPGPGGDLRPGAVDHPVRRRRRGGRDRQQLPVRPGRRRSGRRDRSGRWPWPGGCAPARWTSTAARSTRVAPFGGYKQSGVGRELGAYGLAEFQQVKAIQR